MLQLPPFPPTPIQPLETDPHHNSFFLKREDLLPFSFGGNKARIGLAYLQHMQTVGGTHMLAYGNARSNLCRVLSNLCAARGIPITILSPADDDGQRREAFNEKLCRSFGATILPCLKTGVAESVDSAMQSIRRQGDIPYYIYGDRTGQGNRATPTSAYVPVYDEICRQGDFDVIALACGTGMTQAGLLCGQQLSGGSERIIGLSIARDAASARSHIAAFANAWLTNASIDEQRIEVQDERRQSYGVFDEDVAQTIRDMMRLHGVPMDGTYTGKAYCALRKLAEKEGWQNKRVLFLHTGGTPLFFDALSTL